MFNVDSETVAAAFNEWMRRYIEEPEKFTREFQVINRFLREEADGKTPTLGDRSAAYLDQLIQEIQSVAPQNAPPLPPVEANAAP